MPDDKQNGLELLAFRTASCPAFAKIKKFSESPSPKSTVIGCTTISIAEQSVDAAYSDALSYIQDDEVHSPFLESYPEEFGPQNIEFLLRFINKALPEGSKIADNSMDSIVEVCKDGVLPCLLLNSLVDKDMVDIRALNQPGTEKGSLSFEERQQNQILCIKSLAVSSPMSSQMRLDPAELANGDLEATLKLLWTVVDLATVNRVDVHRFPELRALQQEDEDIFDFLQSSTNDLLLRWVNFVLEQNQSDFGRINNIGDDLADPKAFLEIQKCLFPGTASWSE